MATVVEILILFSSFEKMSAQNETPAADFARGERYYTERIEKMSAQNETPASRFRAGRKGLPNALIFRKLHSRPA
jgi:hypothetical protein